MCGKGSGTTEQTPGREQKMPPEEESGATPESRVAGPHRVAGGLSTSWRVWTSICGQWKAVEGFVRQEETGATRCWSTITCQWFMERAARAEPRDWETGGAPGEKCRCLAASTWASVSGQTALRKGDSLADCLGVKGDIQTFQLGRAGCHSTRRGSATL